MRAKRFISIILSILIVCSSFAGLTVFADEANKNESTKDVASVGADVSVKDVSATSGTTGDCTWTYDKGTKTLTISGKGKMGDYEYASDCPWYYHSSEIITVIIGEGVEEICVGSFVCCENLSSIVVDSNNNFYTEINGNLYSKDKTVLVKYALGKKDVDFDIPNCVTKIGRSAFRNAENLKYITIPDSVTSIDGYAFCCTGLTSILIPSSVTTIGSLAFYGCNSLLNVKILGEIREINIGTFQSCINLSAITIPNSVITICDSAFFNCRMLQNVYYNGTKTQWASIKMEISNSELRQANIEFLIKVDSGTTGDCQWQFDVDTGTLTIFGSGTMDDYQSFNDMPWYVYMAQIKSVCISDGVTSIGSNSFYGCPNLTDVTIFDSVKDIGRNAFLRCTKLVNLLIPGNVNRIDTSAFSECKSLKYVTIPNSVVEMGHHTFSDCTSLEEVNINNKVIGSAAFTNCTNLTKITMSDNVSVIEDNAFNGCIGLISVIIPNSVTEIGYGAFLGCLNLNSITISDNVVWIHENAFGETGYYNNESNWKSGILYIGNHLIRSSSDCESYEIKKGTLSIADGAFYDCQSLESVTIPNSVKRIGDNSFNNCPKLNSIYYYGNRRQLALISSKYFSCLSKINLYCADNTDFGNYSGCQWNVDENAKELRISGNGALDDCLEVNDIPWYVYTPNIETLIINNGITKIGKNVFCNCTNLKSIVLPNCITEINTWAFYNCDSLTDVYFRGSEQQWKSINIDFTNSDILNANIHYAYKVSQTITGVESKYDVALGDKPFNLNAKAEAALSYASDNTSVADVSADGTITIKGAGKATITITAEETEDYYSATATIEITVGKASQDVTGFEPKYDATFGDEPFNLNAKAETSLSYTSDNTSVAEVSADGTITIKGAGKATITITAEETANYNSAIATVEITVNKASQEVSVDKQDYKLTYGAKPFSLNSKAETALSYTSDNTSVAEVSADGTVTIKGAGTATITITAEEAGNYTSATATVKITVAKATQRVIGVKTQYVTSAGKSFILKPKAKTKLTYTSSNKNVAVVSSTGKVTVKAGGYAYITVKASENGNYKSAYVKTKIISAPKDFTSKDVSKVKKTGKTTAKITWKSLAGAKGYTVQLATNKSYKGAKTVKNSKNTANFTNLKKGKTYYVRISAYTKVSGKNYSNKWYTVKFKM